MKALLDWLSRWRETREYAASIRGNTCIIWEGINFRAAARSKRRAKSAPSPPGQSARAPLALTAARRSLCGERSSSVPVCSPPPLPPAPPSASQRHCGCKMHCLRDWRWSAVVDCCCEKCARLTRSHASGFSREPAVYVSRRRTTNTRHHYLSLPPPPPLPGRQRRRWVNRRATPDTTVSPLRIILSVFSRDAGSIVFFTRRERARTRARARARALLTCVNRDADDRCREFGDIAATTGHLDRLARNLLQGG